MSLALLRCAAVSCNAASRSNTRAAGAAEGVGVAGAAGSRRRRATAAPGACPAPPRPGSAIPGPRRWPLLASMPFVLGHKDYQKPRIYKIWDACLREFGPIFRLDMPGQAPTVYISEPEDMEHVLKTTAKSPNRDLFSSLKYIRDNHDFFKKDKSGILSEQGDEWWRVRRRVQPYTAKPKNVQLYLPQTDQVTLEFIERWAALRDENNELPHDFDQELHYWTLETLGLLVFNKRFGYLEENPDVKGIVQAFKAMFSNVQNLEMNSPHWWKFVSTPRLREMRKIHDQLLSYVRASVAEVEAALIDRSPDSEEEELTLVDMLLLDPNLSREDAHAYLMDLLMAGIVAVAVKAAFVLVVLAQHPEEQRKIQEELDAVLGDARQPLSPQHIARLSYTKACVKEVLRVSSSSPLTSRRLTEDTVIRGYLVPKGFNVVLLLQPACKKEGHFARATELLPERWLRGRPLGPMNPYASIPFSLGVRNCIGRRLSEQQIYTLLARLLLKYRFEWHYGPLDPLMVFALIPDKALRLRMVERQ
ncbi:probable cytochrome P450 301a1, mitochondrial [Penaeus japonicus]|uniref:probable cytochrome P450 301a1, mitochondrial n=1 Tax=Penaeus japonicus TaxID=27405 RepID=UPI001C71371C|nr:probable cytochrome P450 301a1, mitochondrial [Penaeus japonicus]